VPGSVLWILSGTDETNERLRQVAAQVGIARERLIFAQTKHNPDHLARYALADLFLDAMPYGAHTTAADALWMAIPIITFPGRSFASRVCASLLHAAGIGDIVCTDGDDYVRRAVGFGRDRATLQPYKQRLIEGRDTCLLFDTPRLARGLEDLYRKMWQDFEADRLPVPDLRNLDVYHEIGTGLDLEAMETLSEEAYRSLYRERLTDLHSVYPIAPDDRFWRK
jgi:predicted O-linked N-acetylglucosamine transferase (SPINDLY family)